jgi:hypothetical protein
MRLTVMRGRAEVPKWVIEWEAGAGGGALSTAGAAALVAEKFGARLRRGSALAVTVEEIARAAEGPGPGAGGTGGKGSEGGGGASLSAASEAATEAAAVVAAASAAAQAGGPGGAGGPAAAAASAVPSSVREVGAALAEAGRTLGTVQGQLGAAAAAGRRCMAWFGDAPPDASVSAPPAAEAKAEQAKAAAELKEWLEMLSSVVTSFDKVWILVRARARFASLLFP